MSNCRKEWLDFDLSWTKNKDGIVRPAWNKGVYATFDFLAHSPETLQALAVSGWNKAYELASDSTATVTTTTTSSSRNQSSPNPETAASAMKQ